MENKIQNMVLKLFQYLHLESDPVMRYNKQVNTESSGTGVIPYRRYLF